MGRLDVRTTDLIVDDEVNELDELEPVDHFDEALTLRSLHPGVIRKSTRRRLEDRIDDIRLQHQINDYDFDIR